MAVKIPLVITAGVIQQLQAGDTIATGSGGFSLDQHVIAANFVVTAGFSATVERYVEIAAGIIVEIGADRDLMIA